MLGSYGAGTTTAVKKPSRPKTPPVGVVGRSLHPSPRGVKRQTSGRSPRLEGREGSKFSRTSQAEQDCNRLPTGLASPRSPHRPFSLPAPLTDDACREDGTQALNERTLATAGSPGTAESDNDSATPLTSPVQGGSVIAECIRRFRNEPPTSREERQRLRQADGAAALKAQDFWWKTPSTHGDRSDRSEATSRDNGEGAEDGVQVDEAGGERSKVERNGQEHALPPPLKKAWLEASEEEAYDEADAVRDEGWLSTAHSSPGINKRAQHLHEDEGDVLGLGGDEEDDEEYVGLSGGAGDTMGGHEFEEAIDAGGGGIDDLDSRANVLLQKCKSVLEGLFLPDAVLDGGGDEEDDDRSAGDKELDLGNSMSLGLQLDGLRLEGLPEGSVGSYTSAGAPSLEDEDHLDRGFGRVPSSRPVDLALEEALRLSMEKPEEAVRRLRQRLGLVDGSLGGGTDAREHKTGTSGAAYDSEPLLSGPSEPRQQQQQSPASPLVASQQQQQAQPQQQGRVEPHAPLSQSHLHSYQDEQQQQHSQDLGGQSSHKEQPQQSTTSAPREAETRSGPVQGMGSTPGAPTCGVDTPEKLRRRESPSSPSDRVMSHDDGMETSESLAAPHPVTSAVPSQSSPVPLHTTPTANPITPTKAPSPRNHHHHSPGRGRCDASPSPPDHRSALRICLKCLDHTSGNGMMTPPQLMSPTRLGFRQRSPHYPSPSRHRRPEAVNVARDLVSKAVNRGLSRPFGMNFTVLVEDKQGQDTRSFSHVPAPPHGPPAREGAQRHHEPQRLFHADHDAMDTQEHGGDTMDVSIARRTAPGLHGTIDPHAGRAVASGAGTAGPRVTDTGDEGHDQGGQGGLSLGDSSLRGDERGAQSAREVCGQVEDAEEKAILFGEDFDDDPIVHALRRRGRELKIKLSVM